MNKHNIDKATPFIKWVGGKRRLIPNLTEFIPKTYNNYYEPFLGGGAFFFNEYYKNLLQNKKTEYFLNDYNKTLINAYEVVKNDKNKLIDNLRLHKKKHNPEYYYEVRSLHNLTGKVENSARFIYLNKTCFNGLYRVNKKGEFNVPIGRYENPDITQEDNLDLVSDVLKRVKLFNEDFEKIKPSKEDFIYIDPPYYPLNKTSSFTAYTELDFGKEAQIRLRDYIEKLTKNGVYVMLSNSDTPFINDIYKAFNINYIKVSRSINSNASKRGKVNEVIITNYNI